MPRAAADSFAPALRRLRSALDAAAEVRDPPDAARVAEDVAAALFHAERPAGVARPPVVVLLGGTGTGKSTLANRLLRVPDRGEGSVTATSFRRTFTAGCVAVAPAADALPDGWLGVPHRVVPADQLPARGVADELLVVELSVEAAAEAADLPGSDRRSAAAAAASADAMTLVDSPDLDGDVPEHHRQADRAFRWAEAVVLVATPEKYQLPEVPRYAQLAARYGVPRRFVMNKADDLAAPDDWASQLGGDALVHVVPRDDAAVNVEPGRSLDALRDSLRNVEKSTAAGLRARCGDVAGRAADGVLAPLERAARRADDAKRRLGLLVRPEAGVDVHPMTRHLQRRLRQQSVLYLMGPQRVFDRVKSVPGMVARLPRTTWDLVTRGTVTAAGDNGTIEPAAAPDFTGELADGLRVLQTRCADVMADLDLPAGDDSWRLDPTEAAAVADRELGELRRWLEARWDSKPRDTRALEWLAKHVPGGRHAAKLSETAPYLLVSASLATSFVTMGTEQVVIGGYLLTTWLGERLSNEVAAKTRETNKRIGTGFADVCDRQVRQAANWAASFAPPIAKLAELEKSIDGVASLAEGGR